MGNKEQGEGPGDHSSLSVCCSEQNLARRERALMASKLSREPRAVVIASSRDSERPQFHQLYKVSDSRFMESFISSHKFMFLRSKLWPRERQGLPKLTQCISSRGQLQYSAWSPALTPFPVPRMGTEERLGTFLPLTSLKESRAPCACVPSCASWTDQEHFGGFEPVLGISG